MKSDIKYIIAILLIGVLQIFQLFPGYIWFGQEACEFLYNQEEHFIFIILLHLLYKLSVDKYLKIIVFGCICLVLGKAVDEFVHPYIYHWLEFTYDFIILFITLYRLKNVKNTYTRY